MRRYYLALSYVLIGVVALTVMVDYSGKPTSRRFYSFQPSQARTDPESCLAVGEKLALTSSGNYGLQLVPGISDAFSERIIESRHQIRKEALQLEPHSRHHALEVVHGIGPKKSLQLFESIDPAR
ncbi:MAG: helix-hairpin-helix domain-containing protein [Deltaproteobacteria bacterium]|nr:helix-hairpin-helix domain-containing protein [Deltaproteobacteria bacterium]